MPGIRIDPALLQTTETPALQGDSPAARLEAAKAAARKRAVAGRTPKMPGAFGAFPVPGGGNAASDLKAALDAIGVEYRKNTRSGQAEVRLPDWADPEREWRVRDGGEGMEYAVAVAAANIRIEEPGGGDEPAVKPVPTSANVVSAAKRLIAFGAPRVDPFIERIAALKWDGKPRIDGLLEHVYELDESYATPPELVHAASRQLWIAAVHRALKPGALIRESVLLQSESEGVGKSTFARQMVMGVDDWIAEDFPFRGSMRDQREKLDGVVVVEVAESVEIKHAPAIKALMTMRQLKNVRRAYAPEAEDSLCRHVFIFTANGTGFLPGNDQNTRFLVVPVKRARGRIEDLLDVATVEQCWAEAHHRVAVKGETPNLDRDLRPVQVEFNQAFVAGADGPWVDRVQNAIDGNQAAIARLADPRKPKAGKTGQGKLDEGDLADQFGGGPVRDWMKEGVRSVELVAHVASLSKHSVGSGNIDRPVVAAIKKLGWRYCRNLTVHGKPKQRGWRHPSDPKARPAEG